MQSVAGDVEMKTVSRKLKPAASAQINGSSLDELISLATAEHRAVVAKERCAPRALPAAALFRNLPASVVFLHFSP